jgi:predicted amidophosphoribosyltransferase
MGELIFQLKYRHNLDVVIQIVDLLEIYRENIKRYDALIPCPASKPRDWQPVEKIVEEMSRRFGV